MSTTQELPYWQLQSIFPSLDSEAYLEARVSINKAIEELESSMNEHAVGSGEALPVSDATVSLFETLLLKLNDLKEDIADLRAYLNGFTATDAFNDDANAESSYIRDAHSQFSTLSKRFSLWLARLELSELSAESELAASHSYALTKLQFDAQHLFDDATEALASQLNQTGGAAWARLHNDLISRTSIEASIPNQPQSEFTLSELKNLQSDANEAIRRAAYKSELDLLEQNAVSFTAAMNSVKGHMNTLMLGRGWSSALEQAVFQNSISLKSLAAMQEACRESFPAFRRYLKAKAKFLGKDKLAWYDLQAPLRLNETKPYAWEDAKAFIITTFKAYSEELSDYAKHSFEQDWLDVPPRKGKRNGAFCMSVPGRKESRIMLNYGFTLDDVFTLAHELGHGYHNQQHFKAERSSFQRTTPMTLAETASIFCETIVTNAMLENASDEERFAILEQDLLGGTQLVIDIYSRFLFESNVFEKRQERELSTEELKGIMLDAQAQTYGDALSASERNPLMWAHKGHYYSTERSFYNYPYTFGYLFGLGLYAEYQQNPEGFQERYNSLLASTGMADAKTLAHDFGIDIEDKQFWKRSLSTAEKRVTEFERLVEQFS